MIPRSGFLCWMFLPSLLLPKGFPTQPDQTKPSEKTHLFSRRRTRPAGLQTRAISRRAADYFVAHGFATGCVCVHTCQKPAGCVCVCAHIKPRRQAGMATAVVNQLGDGVGLLLNIYKCFAEEKT